MIPYSKIAYLARSIKFQMSSDRFRCPNCDSDQSDMVDRKSFITSLNRCRSCKLLFRTPTDEPQRNDRFYNEYYTQGFTTDLPDEVYLKHLLETSFLNTPKDYTKYINILNRIGIGGSMRLFDFGCSWGYGSWQFSQNGFDVYASEISRRRRSYAADRLGVRVIDDPFSFSFISEFNNSFDCFFSAHVLEHVPKPSAVFDLAKRLLKPGGLFVSVTPNGAHDHRLASSNWSKLWGDVHPNFIDPEFLDRSFPDAPRIITSISNDPAWLKKLTTPSIGRQAFDLSAYELLFTANPSNSGDDQFLQ